MSRVFEKMEQEDAQSWTEWVHPLPGYQMQCCDCGLIHEMEFAIGAAKGGSTALNEGETEDYVILFRARRLAEGEAKAATPVSADPG